MDVSSLVHLFFNNPTFSDITMVINDEPLYLHKIILAQSPKFAAAFKNGEDHHNTIVLENYDFSREMKSFLRALYDGAIDLESSNIQFILMLSVEYGVPWIEKKCATTLGESVRPRNALEYLEIACKVRSETLEEICVDVMGVSMDTIHEYLKLGRNLPSKVLVDRCAKVLSRYSYLWKIYKDDLWTAADKNFVMKVISEERSTFSVPAQALALISWLEHQQDPTSHHDVLKLLQYNYLPHTFLVSFISPCLFQLTKRTLTSFLPNMTVKPFTYFVKTDSPEEQATEKYSGVRTCFYSQNLLEMDYREFTVSLPLKLFKYTNSAEKCTCPEEIEECVCSNTISACHVVAAGMMLTINPQRERPMFIDGGRASLYWYLPHKVDSLSWSRSCGVTRGHARIDLTMSEILDYVGESNAFVFSFFI